MREIVTLQFGQRSNFLGTHFFNTQESYFTYDSQKQPLINHDIHFRAGRAPDGTETYTPRALIYDLKGGFGSLRKINALYDINNDNGPVRGLWDGATSTEQQQPIEPSRYQTHLDQGLPTFQLHDSDIRYWSDYNRVFYHPRSAVQLNQYELNSQLMPFENWSAGEELFDQLDKESDLLDRDVRPFAEECDQMQGLQLFTGADDAWGGYASKYLEALRDEFGKISIWVWGVENTAPANRSTRLLRSTNAARTLRAMGQQASAYVRLATVPNSLPGYVDLKNEADWRTSALLCAALESSTLTTRLVGNNQQISLSPLEDMLNSNGSQNLMDLSLSIKRPAGQMSNGIANGYANGVNGDGPTANDQSDQLDINLTPCETSTARKHTFTQVETWRTRLGNGIADTRMDPGEQMRRRQNEESVVERYDSSLLFPTLDSFPNDIFRTTQRTPGLELTAALSTNSSTKSTILDLRNLTTRALPLDERETLYNDLTELSNAYDYGWDSGSDSGEDI